MRVEFWFLVVCRGVLSVFLGGLALLADLTRGHPRVVAAKLGLGGVLLSLTGMVAACGDDEDTEAGTDDSYYWSCYTAPWTGVDAVSYSHDEDSWQYLVELYGWGDSVTLDIHADDGLWTWEEQHELVNTDYSEDGSWDVWELDLVVVTDEAKQETGLTTLFAADDATEATMTWRVRVYEDGAVADCAVWGHDPASFDDVACREIEAE